MLKLFKNMFGDDFFANTAFLFTRWGQSKKDKRIRERAGDTEGKKELEFNRYIKEKLGFDTTKNPIQCFFIDNTLNDKDNFEDAEDGEQEAFFKSVSDLHKFTYTLKPFKCHDMQAVLTANAELA